MAKSSSGHPTLTMEAYSIAFVSAIIQAGGCTIMNPVIDDDKVDFALRRHNSGTNPYGVSSPQIDVQMKATTSHEVDGEHFVYDLDADTHRHLSDPNRHLPALLMVVAMPAERENWIHVSDAETALRNQAFWFELSGLEPTANTSSVRLKIPLANQVNPESVNALLDRVKLGERALV